MKFSLRPTLYVALVAAVMLGMFAHELRTAGIFACSAAGYSEDAYLAYCNSTSYGDYDHGAFWFDLEPEARSAAGSADVLFLGTSRMQFAFSASATDQWFGARGISYYLLGFSHSENVMFTSPLVASIAPEPRAYVINVDRFFEGETTAPAAEIFHGDGVKSRYRRKRLWQYVHRAVCGTVSFVCRDSLAFVRIRANGVWSFQGSAELPASGVGDATEAPKAQWADRAARAKAFIGTLGVEPGCVFLTVVPWAATPWAESTAIAKAVGVDLIAPRIDGLRTFDGSHLDDASAERWAQAFFEVAGPEIEACVASASSGPETGYKPPTDSPTYGTSP